MAFPGQAKQAGQFVPKTGLKIDIVAYVRYIVMELH